MNKETREQKESKAAKEGKEPKERQYLARVFISLKPTVNDPEGKTIAGALASLGFQGVDAVRSGKYFQLTVRAKDERKAGKQLDQMCARLLANPVIETYRYEVAEAKG